MCIRDRAKLEQAEKETIASLESFINSNVILSVINGNILKHGNLENINVLDTLIHLEGTLERSNRGKSIIAQANKIDAKRIYLNSDLHILLKDGSRVSGIVEEENTIDADDKASFKMGVTEEVSYVDIEHIVIPAKKSNFIEKVMENF